jgi:2-oxo-4-hydroxy-4-carboxy-5-ureidoimidazoline decarboxylase
MVDVMYALSPTEQIALIQAHPDLGTKAKMATASVQEQAGVGLDQLTAEEFELFHRLNLEYKTKHGFPFLVAVRGHTKTSLLQVFEQRLARTSEKEHKKALLEIEKISRYRLDERITS